MTLLEQIRTKLGIAAEVPDSAAGEQVLADVQRRIDANRETKRELEGQLVNATLIDPDGGAGLRARVRDLDLEHDSLLVSAGALRLEIVEAQAREQAAQLETLWQAAFKKADAALKLGSGIEQAIKPLVAAVDKLARADLRFIEAIPEPLSRSWLMEFQDKLFSIVVDELAARLRGHTPERTVLGALKFHVSQIRGYHQNNARGKSDEQPAESSSVAADEPESAEKPAVTEPVE